MRDIRQLFGNNTILAPMAGYTDSAYRSICCQYGVGMTFTEMVSSKALMMGNSNTKALLHRFDNDKVCGVQIFGHQPDTMSQCVNIESMRGFDIIDINMGCPVRKIVANGDGSALLEDINQASRVISAVKSACGDRYVTVKFRLGVTDSDNAVDFAKMCADSGADMITVHFRTRKQMYSGKADYSKLPDIVQAVDIPVIANGDITTTQQYQYLTEQCGAFGVAIGRGAIGRPYIFSQLANQPYTFDIMATLAKQLQMMSISKNQRTVLCEIKKHIPYYLSGMKGNKATIIAVNKATSIQEIVDVVGQFVGGAK